MNRSALSTFVGVVVISALKIHCYASNAFQTDALENIAQALRDSNAVERQKVDAIRYAADEKKKREVRENVLKESKKNNGFVVETFVCDEAGSKIRTDQRCYYLKKKTAKGSLFWERGDTLKVYLRYLKNGQLSSRCTIYNATTECYVEAEITK